MIEFSNYIIKYLYKEIIKDLRRIAEFVSLETTITRLITRLKKHLSLRSFPKTKTTVKSNVNRTVGIKFETD